MHALLEAVLERLNTPRDKRQLLLLVWAFSVETLPNDALHPIIGRIVDLLVVGTNVVLYIAHAMHRSPSSITGFTRSPSNTRPLSLSVTSSARTQPPMSCSLRRAGPYLSSSALWHIPQTLRSLVAHRQLYRRCQGRFLRSASPSTYS